MATLKIKKEDGTWAFVETAEAVKYTEQILTNEQKIQAKNNIGVTEDLTALKSYIDNKPVTKSDTIKDSDTESTYMTIHYAGDGLENADWVAAWNPDDPTQIKAIAPSKLLKGYVPKEAVLASGTDLNTVLESGFYRLSDSHVNVPDNLDCNYGNMIVSRGADTALQIVTPYSGAARLCYRSGVVKNGAFVNVTNWRYILDNETYSYLNNITGVITSTSSLVESWQDHDDYIATIGAISNFIDNKLTCLAEGTPINMYDGTYKNIEDVKTGDIVLSYNPVTKEQVPAIVLTKVQTGSERCFNADMFSNGKSLISFGYEGIYDSTVGVIRNLENINSTFTGLDVSGENITWTFKRATRFHGDKRARYHILTSNNLLFANDILIGALPFDKYEVLVDYNIPIPDELKEIWKQDAEEYNTNNTNIITNAEFQKSMASAFVDYRKFTDIIRNNRNLLNQSDYKSHKYAEGKLTEEDWQESNIKREEYRKAINEAQVQLQENEALRTKIWNEQRKGRTLRDIFELCCERDNALYEKVKEYYCQSEKDD